MPWRYYDLSSVAANVLGVALFNISTYDQLDGVTRRCFFTYAAVLVVHALVLRQIAKSSAYERWRHPLTAFSRLAALAAMRRGLEGWTRPSQNCKADLFRYMFFRHGILAQIFLTFYFPLPGLYHQAVHVTTTAWFIKDNSSRVCSILLDGPSDPCDYRSWISSSFWLWTSRAGQSLAGVMYAHIDETRLESLDASGKCHVAMVWLQVR